MSGAVPSLLPADDPVLVFVQPMLDAARRLGRTPTLGPADWAALPAHNPRKLAAVARAALAWHYEGTVEALTARLSAELAEADVLARYRIRAAGLDVHAALTAPREYDQLDEHIERRLGPPPSLLRAATDVSDAELRRRRAEAVTP